jgi:hypothetical protein
MVIAAVLLAGHLTSFLILKKKIDKVLQPSLLLDKIRKEVNAIIVELNGTTERNIALLEDRLGALKELLSQADKKLSLLQRDAEQREINQKLYARLGQARSEAPAEDEMKQEEIVRLHAAGFSPHIIAKRVGAPLGEVELIISLAGSKG